MPYKQFVEKYLAKGLIKKQKTDLAAVEQFLKRAQKDLKTAKANLVIDESIAFTVAYLAMLHAGRAFMFMKGWRPDDGAQHKTVVEFVGIFLLENEEKILAGHFERMRRKRNVFTYDVGISISLSETEGAIHSAAKFVRWVCEAVKKEHPQREFSF